MRNEWPIRAALYLKVQYVVLEEKDLHWLIFFTSSLFVFIYWINKLTPYYFTLFICGGPCHLSCYKQHSRDLIFFLRTACFFFFKTTQCPFKDSLDVLTWSNSLVIISDGTLMDAPSLHRVSVIYRVSWKQPVTAVKLPIVLPKLSAC